VHLVQSHIGLTPFVLIGYGQTFERGLCQRLGIQQFLGGAENALHLTDAQVVATQGIESLCAELLLSLSKQETLQTITSFLWAGSPARFLCGLVGGIVLGLEGHHAAHNDQPVFLGQLTQELDHFLDLGHRATSFDICLLLCYHHPERR
jgi:hypothetical protein